MHANSARSHHLVLALAGALSLQGCPEAADRKVSQQCTKAYEKCLLPSGVLGICDTVPCSGEQSPPCLTCRSQH